MLRKEIYYNDKKMIKRPETKHYFWDDKSLAISDTEIKYKFGYDPDMIAFVKTMGFRWRKSEKVWWVKNNNMNMHVVRKIFPKAGLPPIESDFLNFYTPSEYLMPHQKDGAVVGITNPRWGFFYDTGVGKTVLAIELIKMKKVKALVVCPLSIIDTAWKDDLNEFAPELKAVNLWRAWKKTKTGSNTKEKLKEFEETLHENDVCIINFESFKSIKEDFLDKAGFEMLIVDESSKVKDYKSAITKELTAFSDEITYTYLLSGTPAPNTPMEYFSQIRMLDPTLFGTSFYKFRLKYFTQVSYNQFKWIPKFDKLDDMYKKIGSVSSVVMKEDVLSLPERTFSIREVTLAPKELKAYKDMVKHLIAVIDDEECTAANAAVKIMKLREITAGFLFDDDKKLHVFGKSKLMELKSLLEEIGKHQVIIWTQFQYEAKIINEMLGQSSRICNGTVSQDDKLRHINLFKDGDVQYLIGHPKSIGHGQTLVNCTYSINFSSSYSYEEDKQSKDRIYRKGQKNVCTYYALIAKGTIDMVIYKALMNKDSGANAAFDYIKGINLRSIGNDF